MKSKQKTKFILTILVFLVFLLLPISFLMAGYTYTPMEEIPGLGKPTDFYTYVSYVYRFGIGAIGMAAMVMIVIGGFMYVSSAGNNSKMETAKKIITDAIMGLVMAMLAYLVLYTINPDLVNIKRLSSTATTNLSSGTTASQGSSTLSSSNTCSQYPNTNNVINFSTSDKTSLPSSCSSYDSAFQSAASSSGVSAKILKAIAAIESSCNSNIEGDGGASCGIMQMGTATSGKDCSYLKNNPTETILLAANYIASNSGSHGNILANMFAGYNGGFGSSSSDGKKGPLASSSDCPGALAYQCCINPGELAGTQDYVFKGVKYYNAQ